MSLHSSLTVDTSYIWTSVNSWLRHRINRRHISSQYECHSQRINKKNNNDVDGAVTDEDRGWTWKKNAMKRPHSQRIREFIYKKTSTLIFHVDFKANDGQMRERERFEEGKKEITDFLLNIVWVFDMWFADVKIAYI